VRLTTRSTSASHSDGDGLRLEHFIHDLKHSLRLYSQSPAFTLAAIAALTLGIGVNTAIFSVVNAVLLRPVKFPDPDRLVIFMTTTAEGAFPGGSPAKFGRFRQQTDVVEHVSVYTTGLVNFTGGSFPEQLRSGQVSADFFHLFGAPIVRGRAFSTEEDLPIGPRVALLSERLWVERFKNDPNIVGQTISLGGEPHTVVGILGRFDFEDFGPNRKYGCRFSWTRTRRIKATTSSAQDGSSLA